MKKRIEGYLMLDGRGQYRFAFFDSGPQRYSGILESCREYDTHWGGHIRHRPTLYELTDPEKSVFMIGWKDGIYERYNRLRDAVEEKKNTTVSARIGGGNVEFVYVPDYTAVQPEIKMSVNKINEKIDTNFAVLSFHIRGYKTERDGEIVQVVSADDVKRHFGPGTVSQTIEDILRQHGLCAADIISISGDVTGSRDPGSWDFWMFVRNPNSTIDAQSRAQIEEAVNNR